MNMMAPVIFITIALIQLGIIINSISFIKIYPKEKAIKYWLASILSSCAGIFGFAWGLISVQNLARGSIFLTFSNIIYFSSAIFLALYTKSIKQIVANENIKIYLIMIVLFGIGFEFVRDIGDFIDRQIYAAIALAFVYLILLVEIKKQKLNQDLKYLRIFSITTCLEFILLIIRIFILLNNSYGPVNSLNQIPTLPLIMLWLMLVVNVWSYIAITSYWTEKLTSSIAVDKIENTRIKSLLNEKYRLINSLVIANKTAISGALSASIAHEINQPLGAVKINSQHLSLLLKTRKERVLIDNIIKDNDRAAKIISILKKIFIGKTDSFKIINFEKFIEQIEPLLQEVIKDKNISIRLLVKLPVYVNINCDEFQQVLLNLMSNSITALEKTPIKNKLIQIKTSIKNNRFIFSFHDNGCGVNSKIKNKIFDLYESSEKKHSGLGLWIVKYIIDRHHGTISLNKKCRMGTEFLISLPIYRNA